MKHWLGKAATVLETAMEMARTTTTTTARTTVKVMVTAMEIMTTKTKTAAPATAATVSMAPTMEWVIKPSIACYLDNAISHLTAKLVVVPLSAWVVLGALGARRKEPALAKTPARYSS